MNEWYLEEKKKFDEARSSVDHYKASGNKLTYRQSLDLTKSLSQFIDFGKKESALLLDIWHMKVNYIIDMLQSAKEEGDEELSCDGPKYWLEEA